MPPRGAVIELFRSDDARRDPREPTPTASTVLGRCWRKWLGRRRTLHLNRGGVKQFNHAPKQIRVILPALPVVDAVGKWLQPEIND